ncbi:MAG: hypothetical protein NTZ83_04645, partial [Candidatus Pacearchaeota archaeon]|nr:hypothetical protein [Candidatus Pacearchaeota archaeon]
MIKIFSFSKNKLKEIAPEEISKDKKINYWIDLACSNVGEIKLIRENFNIHPTTEEDILSNQTRTKYEEFEDNTAIIFHGIKELEAVNIKTYNLSFILGENYFVNNLLDTAVCSSTGQCRYSKVVDVLVSYLFRRSSVSRAQACP